MNLVVNNTPVEEHDGILVKREDLSCPEPGPKFSKVRGLASHLVHRPETVIGALDTYHSKAGWGNAFICKALGKKAVVFYPHYMKDPELREQQINAFNLGARVIPLPAGRSSILYHRAKKRLREIYPGAYMLPNALKLPETITETSSEVLRTPASAFMVDSVVVSISSGTIAAGVLRGLIIRGFRGTLILHMGYSRSKETAMKYVLESAGLRSNNMFQICLVDEEYSYKDSVDVPCPFPCNEYYDLKAWKWLQENRRKHRWLKGRILFWNIGE